jgi:hypothetical protein
VPTCPNFQTRVSEFGQCPAAAAAGVLEGIARPWNLLRSRLAQRWWRSPRFSCRGRAPTSLTAAQGQARRALPQTSRHLAMKGSRGPRESHNRPYITSRDGTNPVGQAPEMANCVTPARPSRARVFVETGGKRSCINVSGLDHEATRRQNEDAACCGARGRNWHQTDLPMRVPEVCSLE